MKKTLFAAIFLSAALLCSCAKDVGTGGFLSYQDDIWRVRGTYTENGTDYGVELLFSDSEDKKSTCRRIEYFSPESLEGLSFTLEGDSVSAELFGVRISESSFEPSCVFRCARLLSFSEGDIYEVKAKKQKRTLIKGKNGDGRWQVQTDENGLPTRILWESDGGKEALLIEGLSFKEK